MRAARLLVTLLLVFRLLPGTETRPTLSLAFPLWRRKRAVAAVAARSDDAVSSDDSSTDGVDELDSIIAGAMKTSDDSSDESDGSDDGNDDSSEAESQPLLIH